MFIVQLIRALELMLFIMYDLFTFSRFITVGCENISYSNNNGNMVVDEIPLFFTGIPVVAQS